jgi:lipopolysaccharide transport system permease protein
MPATTEFIIEAGRTERNYWTDLWRFRELLGFLAWRDIKVRYKQTILGAGWALIQPVVTLVVFTFVFGRVARLPSGNSPYPLLVMAGLLAWQLFANALSGVSGSLIHNTHLISKVYFPRLIIPLSSVAVALVDFLVVLGLYAGMSIAYRLFPDWRLLLLPFYILVALVAALGLGLWLAALTVRYRDFRYVLPFIIQVGVFLSPVGFNTSNLPNWRLFYSLNPVVGIIDGFRWCLLREDGPIYLPAQVIGLAVSIALLWSGIWFFRHTERGFADVI